MNDDHTIVGTLHQPSMPKLAFISQGGAVELLPGFKNVDQATAYGIADDGTIVGFAGDFRGLHACKWVDRKLQILDIPVGPSSVAYDISDSGFICGWMGIHPHPLFGASAFIYKDGSVNDLASITGISNTEAHAVNNFGQACGTTWTFTDQKDPIGSTIRRGFIWSGKNVEDIGALPGHVETYVKDLNDAATIVGYCLDEKGFSRAFMWHNGIMTDLNDLIPPELGYTISSAEAINHAGQITGTGRKADGNGAAFVLSPVPPTPGDYDCDKDVDVDDLLGIINRWGPVIGDHPADFTSDGIVNVNDLLIVIDNWTL
jgi:probable HAF family extracellular repeat protein